MKHAVVIVAVLALTTTCCAQMSRFQGTWDSVDSSRPGPTRVVIEGKKIRLMGNCDSKPCYLGEVKATPIFSLTDKKVIALQATKSTKLAETFVEIYPESAQNLRISIRTNPALPAGRRAMTTSGIFRRTAPAP